MKKLMMGFLATMIISATAHAADNKSVSIWGDVLGAALGIMEVGIDFKVGEHSTLGPIGYFMNFGTSGLSTLNIKSTGYGGMYRYYLTKAIESSWRVSLFGLYTPVTMTAGAYTGTTNIMQGGGLFGYHWVPGIINLGFDLGAVYYSSSNSVTLVSGGSTQTYSFPFSGVGLGIQLSAGLTF